MKTLCILACAVLFGPAANSFAAERHVPGGGTLNYPTIQSAVNASVAGDVIWVQPGTYNESVTFRSANITLTSTNPADPNVVQSTIIVGTGTKSTVSFASGQTSQTLLTGFTLRGGGGNPLWTTYLAGGAIYCSNASPRIVGNIIESNRLALTLTNLTTLAGGIFVWDGSPTIARNIIRDNQANIGGAILSLGGSARIQDNFIYRNTGSYGGGGVYVSDNGTVINNTLVENTPDNAYVDTTALMANNIIAHLNPGGTGVMAGPSAGALPDWFKYNDVWETNGTEILQYIVVGTNLTFASVSAAGTIGNLAADPGFTDTTNFDLRLSATSPCINAGDSDGLRSTYELDVLGNPRVVALRVDIGAHEFNGAINFPPLANAGPDQVLHWNGRDAMAITLDATNSVDPEGDPLQYVWSQTQGPPVTLVASNAHASFNPTSLGQYVFHLVVNDGLQDGAPDEIRIVITNSPPLANAGPDQVIHWNGRDALAITMDATNSVDPEGDPLQYVWSQTQGPPVTLVASNAHANFIPNGLGQYVFSLVVNDGLQDGAPDEIHIVITNSPPIASAGPDQLIHWNGGDALAITMDATTSVDPEGDPLQYVWSQTQGPPVTLLASNAHASFIPNGLGQYVFSLVVNDGLQDSAPDEIRIVITNLPPIASAGFGLNSLAVPEIVALDGSHSLDPEGGTLVYQWRQTQGPAARLISATQARAAFMPAGAGAYEFELTVNDAFNASAPSRCTFYLGAAPPVANAGPTRYAGRASIILDGSGSFAPNTNTPLSYSWRQISGPPATFLSATNIQRPTLRSFTQTTNVREAVFELTVSAGGVTSAPAMVKVVIVPGWGNSAISQINPPFNTNRPTVIAFSGGNCDTGGSMGFPSDWSSRANLFTVSYSRDPNSSASGPRYFGYGDQMIVLLSASAPAYSQPIQTMGFSTGCMPACDVAERFNIHYKDPRYRVNRISFLDSGCSRDYNANISNLMTNREAGVMFWVDNYYSLAGRFRSGVLNVQFPTPANHETPNAWYFPSWNMAVGYNASTFNNGVFAGGFFSVVGPGKNYQLETGESECHFGWTNGASSSSSSFPLNRLTRIAPAVHPARLPGVVQLSTPANGAVATPRRTRFSCVATLNAVKYQILIGPDAQHVTAVVWEGNVRPLTNTLPNLPWGRTWWTIRVTDAYGTTSWADPRLVLRDTDADGLNDEAEVLTYHTDPDNADTDADGLSDGNEVLAYHSDPHGIDTDADGHLDGQEIMAGTDPLQPNVGFSISCQPEGVNALRFSWYSDAGYLYALEFSPLLELSSWQTLETFGPPARLIQYTNPIPTNASGFYRVRSYPGTWP